MAEKTYAQRLAEALRSHEEIEYYSFLGAFVNQYASAEAEMQLALRHFSKTHADVAKAIFSGTRIEAGQSFIKRILEVKPLRSASKQAILVDALDQLLAINNLRNHILHYGSKWQDGKTWLVTNASVAHANRTLREERFTVELLHDLTVDLLKIGVTLSTFTHRLPAPLRKIIAPVLSGAWSYTRPGLEKKGQGVRLAVQSVHDQKRPSRNHRGRRINPLKPAVRQV